MRTLIIVALAIFPLFVGLLWSVSILRQVPSCGTKYSPQEAAEIMQKQPIHSGPPITSAMDLSNVANGFNTACDAFVNKTDVAQHIGEWVADDSYFKTKSKWAPLHFTTVSIVGWDNVVAGSGSSVQTVAKVGAVNIFQAPLWWREQYLFMNMDYHICTYFNESTRLILSERTKSVLLQEMVYTKENAPESWLAYSYEISNASPRAQLEGESESWGRTRLHFVDLSNENFGFGRKCYVWSHFNYGGSSLTFPQLPIIAVVSFIALIVFISSKMGESTPVKAE